MKSVRALVTAALAAAVFASPAFAQYDGVPRGGQIGQSGRASGLTPEELRNVRFDQKLGEQIPLDLVFKDETGAAVRLGDYFGKRPVVLSLVYYECPMLCTEVLNGLVKALKVVSLEPGRDFEIVTVSFDARETPQMASDKKRAYLQRYQRPDSDVSWHFLTGEPEAIEALTEAVGFQYAWDPATGQYAHAAGIMVATPGGRLAKVLLRASSTSPARPSPRARGRLGNKIGNPVDQILLYCFHYDPTTAVRPDGGAAHPPGGIVTMLALATFMFVMSGVTAGSGCEESPRRVAAWRPRPRTSKTRCGTSSTLPERASTMASRVDNL